jgi:hypothetical protein
MSRRAAVIGEQGCSPVRRPRRLPPESPTCLAEPDGAGLTVRRIADIELPLGAAEFPQSICRPWP